MGAYQKTKTLSESEAAYLAGLIDGDGTVTLGRKHRADNRQLIVSISNTERKLQEYIQQICGTGKITGKRSYSVKHRPSYAYTVTNRQALDLISQVAGFLRTYKAERCRLILADYRALTPRNGKYTPELAGARKVFESRVLNIKP